jgi:Holliday junction DNA helicase RuvA
MIAYLEGEIISISENSAIIKAGGVGYEVNMARPALEILTEGNDVKLFISESISPYDGTVLYGCLSAAELGLFKLLRSSVPNTGAKKALEYLSKAVKALPDFKKAVIAKDTRVLTGVFGFTQKTAVKLIGALKDKISAVKISGESKIHIAGGAGTHPVLSQVFAALLSLGFSGGQSKKAIESLHEDDIDANATTEDLIKRALRVISK